MPILIAILILIAAWYDAIKNNEFGFAILMSLILYIAYIN